MTDYTKLVKALRLCQFGECGCGKCYYKELKGDWCTEDNHPEFFDCDDKLKLDAADAIEELSKTVKDLTTKVECSPMQISGKAFDRAIEAWNEKSRKVVQE